MTKYAAKKKQTSTFHALPAHSFAIYEIPWQKCFCILPARADS